MENKGLLFIPDISGFSRFVSETDIEHSRLIIQELLEVLINANQLGLEVSEVEGDAILFYKFGPAPAIRQLFTQVEKMFCEFHRQLRIYDIHRFCQCKACLSAVNLTLKVITHYGEFTGYNVKSFNKLIGKDVIVAHQLLKNEIPEHEYWLVTRNLVPGGDPAGLAHWMRWDQSAKQTEAGEIAFHYTHLGQLKNKVEVPEFPRLELSRKKKVLSATRDYDVDHITLFHAAGDYNFRPQWEQGVRAVAEISHVLPRVGMRCRLITDTGERLVFASSFQFSADKVIFSETDRQKRRSSYFTLERISDRRTRLTVDHYIRDRFPHRLYFNIFEKKQMQSELEHSLLRLEKVAMELKLPG